MLLIIFGLRGFKHELESQIALKCAAECFEKIKSIEQIDDVAVAVTTGKHLIIWNMMCLSIFQNWMINKANFKMRELKFTQSSTVTVFF